MEKRPLFGLVREGQVQLSELGLLADNCWKQIETVRSEIALDAYIVMPNHIHGILHVSSEITAPRATSAARELTAGSLGAIIGQFKATVTKRSQFLQPPPMRPIWQRNYYDHIIRSAAALEKIRQYIVRNPARWEDDELYIN